MVIVARDLGHDPLSSEATVIVHVDDINDNAPSVTIRTLHGNADTELPESSAVGSFVAHVSVVDRDSAASGLANCSREGNRGSGVALDRSETSTSGLANCSVNHPSVFTLQQNRPALHKLSW